MGGAFLSRNKVDVFVSVGTHPQPFMRLLNEIARLADNGKLKGNILVQAGTTPFSHPKMKVVDFLSLDEFENMLQNCKLFITHAGEGNIGQALQLKKQTVVVPRKEEFHEHTDNHQEELARAMSGQLGVVVMGNIANLEHGINLALKQKVEGTYKGYIPQILSRIAREEGMSVSPIDETKVPIPKTASIIMATLNGGIPLIHAVNGMLQQEFSGKYEVIVVDDGSFDGKTPSLLKENFGKNPKVKLITLERSGVCKARNAGIRASQYEVVINMDHDCIPRKDWLQTMVNGFDTLNVGAVSAYGHYGGTSTGFRKEILDHLKGYDEDFFYYREDTDLSFRIMELGFVYKRVDASKKYTEDRTLVTPKGIGKIAAYTLQRFKYHMNDVLLHKKHPTPMCNEFLRVKWDFFVDPIQDFKVATGLWEDSSNKIALSSPRGLVFLSNRSPVHFFLIVLAGMGYAFAIKLARLAGSIKHGHLLV